MRYHYTKPKFYMNYYGITYRCNHPVYDICTLYKSGKKGLAVIQQHFNSNTKTTWWGELEPWLVDDIYLNENFERYFESKSGICKNGLYPTVTVRQIMWALRMRPLPKHRWETVFDRKFI